MSKQVLRRGYLFSQLAQQVSSSHWTLLRTHTLKHAHILYTQQNDGTSAPLCICSSLTQQKMTQARTHASTVHPFESL